MRQLLELIPIILFFVTYKMNGTTIELLGFSHTVDGIYSATAVLMLATLCQIALTWLLTRELDKKLVWLFVAVMVLGSATLILRNELFIQWKPTIFNWGLAIVFLGTLIASEKSLLERMLGEQIDLPKLAWLRLNQLWIANFLLVGTLNIYVAYQFSEATWVSYKLYSAIGFTLALMVATMIVVLPHIREEEEPAKQPDQANQP